MVWGVVMDMDMEFHTISFVDTLQLLATAEKNVVD